MKIEVTQGTRYLDCIGAGEQILQALLSPGAYLGLGRLGSCLGR